MRLWRLPVLGLALLSTVPALAQRQLLGKVVKGDVPPQQAAARAKVVLDDSGGQTLTDDNGLFHLFLPDALHAGDEVTITVTVLGYGVFDPPAGKLRIPSDLKTPVRIALLANDSPKWTSDAQLRALIDRARKESTRQPVQATANSPPVLEQYL